MIALKDILVATDFGEPADAALTYGRELARTYGATLHVVHIVDDVYLRLGGDAYVAVLISGKAQIWLFHGGTGAITVLGTATYTATPPTTITFTVTGSGTSTTLSLTDGTGHLSLTVTGSTLTTLNSTGGVGIFAQGAGGTVDNFSVSGT